jgi:hypothetical protein
MIRRFIAVALLTASSALPCRADDFCDAIVRVTQDAGSGFSHVRGDPYFPDGKRYEEVPALPGAGFGRRGCAIFPVARDAPLWRYVCLLPVPTLHEGVPDAAALGTHAVSCLTDAHEKVAVEKPKPSEYFRATTDEATITIGIDIPSDAGEPNYYVFIDQKAH